MRNLGRTQVVADAEGQRTPQPPFLVVGPWSGKAKSRRCSVGLNPMEDFRRML